MTENLTAIVNTVFVLLALTVFTTGMREDKGVIVGLLLSTTVAIVFRQLILGILGTAIGTSPTEHCDQSLGLKLSYSHVILIHIEKLVSSVVHSLTIGV